MSIASHDLRILTRPMDEVHALKRLASIPASLLQRTTCSTWSACPPHIFDQITDILADLLLEDIKQYPQIPTGPRIDRFSGRENTVLLTQNGEK